MRSFKAPLVLALLVLVASSVRAAEGDSTFVGWRKSLTADLTITQAGYSDSWDGDEVSSFNWVSSLNGKAEKQLREWFDYKSTLKISFGQSRAKDDTTSSGEIEWSDWRKSTDLIDWENVGLFTMHKFVDPYTAFRVETRFYDGTNADKKLWFSPLRLTESAGIARKVYTNKDDFILSRLGLALRQTFKSAIIDEDLNTTDSTLTDGGFESVTDASLRVHENILYTSKLTVYKALFYSKSDEVKGTPYEDDWKAIDINWENIFAAQVTRFITANLYTQVLYDKQISKKGRFKETVAIGVSFKML